VVDIICISSWHGIGGAQMNAAMLVNEFEKRGYTAELVFVFEREPEVDFGTRSSLVLSKGIPSSIKEWYSLFRSVKENIVNKKPLIIFGFHPFSNVLGSLASLYSKNTQMIGTQRNPSESQGKFVSLFERFLGCFVYRNNICVSQSVLDSYSHYPSKYINKTQVIHNGTPPLIEVDVNSSTAKAHFKMSTDKLVLGCLGRLHEQKNVEFALDVVSLNENVILYIAGTGHLESMLREKAKALYIENRVVFLGSIYEGDITRFYRAIDVLLFPSRFEGFGRVLIEALSEGTLVLANDIPVVKEVANEAAIRMPLIAELWANQLDSIINNKDEYLHYSQKGIKRAMNFTISAMADGYLKAAGLAEVKNGK
jgi:glycosyltransferase involved in cell wall biosynthesis